MAINRKAMKALPIQGYLDYQGIEYKDEGRYLRLIDHDSLLIDLKKNTFIWNKTHGGGDLGDFIVAYEGISPKEAWTKWTAYSRYVQKGNIDVNKYKANQTQPQRDFDFARWHTSNRTNAAKDYLVTTRGLNSEFVDNFFNSGLIYQGTSRKDKETQKWQRPPVLFTWQDEDGKVVGLDQQGTEINFDKFKKRGTEKKVAAGSNSDYGFNFRFGNGRDKLIVFEAPIDALSYAQENFKALDKSNSTLLALSSTNQNKIFKQLDRMHKQNGQFPDTVVIATDNDIAGYEVASRINQFEIKGIKMLRAVPVEGKDWNDQIKSGKRGQQILTLDQSDQQLERLKKLQDSTQLTERETATNAKSPTQDEHQVTHKAVNKGTNNSLNKADRRAQNRANNEQIINKSLHKFMRMQKDPLQVEQYLNYLATGQRFSPANSMLIKAQQPKATLVMGYKQFKQQGIKVNKGEKGIRIYGAPVMLKSVVLPNSETIFWADATPEQRDLARKGTLGITKVKNYPIENVFDVSQTNASPEDIQRLKPVQPIHLSAKNTPQQLDNVYQELQKFAKDLGFNVYDSQTTDYFERRAKHNGHDDLRKGVTIRDTKNSKFNSVVLRENLPMTEKVATLAQQVAHVQLFANAKKSANPEIHQMQEDMTSYVVLRNMGMDPATIKKDYITNWDKDMDTLSSLTVKNRTALAPVTQASNAITERLSNRLSNGTPSQAVTHEVQEANNKTQTKAQQTEQTVSMRR